MNNGPYHPDRRGFVAGALAMAVGAATVRGTETKAFALDDQKPFRGQTRRLKITRGNRPVASLIFSTDYPTHFRLKPELHLCTPAGVPVTGSHEFSFIHHQSIMCGHGRVQVESDDRVIDFYRQLPFPDGGRADKWHAKNRNLYQLGPSGLQRITKAQWHVTDQVVIRLELEWTTREMGRETGDTLLIEERIYRISGRAGMTVVDVFSRLAPAGRPVTLLPENDHGYIGVRVHDLIDVEDGGAMHDSEGRTNPTEHFRDATGDRRIPRWVDCTGTVGEATVGMALMSHPANVRNEWYVREFGLMIVSAAQTQAVRITTDAPFEFGVRFVAHDGQLPKESAEQLHADFAGVRADKLRALVHDKGTPGANE
jgi:hypothetical protein